MVASKWNNPDGTRMTCSAPECDRDILHSGLCQVHVQRMRKRGSLDLPRGKWFNDDGSRMECSLEQCHYPVKSLGLCRTHWAQTRRGEEPHVTQRTRARCTVNDCGKPAVGGGLCNAHYLRLRIRGDVDGAVPVKTRWAGEDGGQLRCYVEACNSDIVSHAVCMRHYNYLRYYSLSLEEIGSLFSVENYRCSNSSCPETANLHLDHDHSCCPPTKGRKRLVSCGRCIRGWLCRRCNSILGFSGDSPEILEGLIEHLERGSGE